MSCDVVKMSRCIWCGGDKQELVIATKETKEWCSNESNYVITDYEPCDKCEEEFAKGTVVMEVAEDPLVEGQPPIQDNLYPTSNIWVISSEVARNIFNTDSPKLFVDKETAEQIGLYGPDSKDNR